MKRLLPNFWLAALVVAAIVQPAFAAPALVTDRALLEANDSVDWSVLGPAVVVPPPWVDSPIQTPSASGGLGVEVVTTQGINPAPRFRRVDEGTVFGTGWRGNFQVGDALLFSTAGSSGPFSIEFSEPVFGVGAQIQATTFGSFRAHIRAFDGDDDEVLHEIVNGQSNFAQNNSAIFVGVRASTPVIRRIEISAEVFTFTGLPLPLFEYRDFPFAINQLDINREERPIARPIPVFGGAGTGLLALLMMAAGLFFARSGHRRNLRG